MVIAKVVNGAIVNVEMWPTMPKGNEYHDVTGKPGGIGWLLDAKSGVFYEPAPFPSWKLNKTNLTWSAPKPKPKTGISEWDETSLSWTTIKAPIA